MIVENVDGVQKVRLKLPVWLLADKAQVAAGEKPSGFFTWTDNDTQKKSVLCYNDSSLAEEAIVGTPSLADAAPFPISSTETLRNIILALEVDGAEEIHIDRVSDHYYHWAKITVTDFLTGLKTLLYDSDRPRHPEETQED